KAAVYPLDLRPKISIDAFLTAFRNSLVVEHLSGQLAVFRKVKDPCRSYEIRHGGTMTLPIGSYCYSWGCGELFHIKDKTRFKLTEPEEAMIQKLFRSRKLRQVEFTLDRETRESDAFSRLRKRLGLDFVKAEAS
ncbi:MAG: hypothetical protein NC930_09050, partial [Candidatus Omnitrophica bacterium]|nr:hypothetical protein [Candidatus Omnitrophota bacterium]